MEQGIFLGTVVRRAYEMRMDELEHLADRITVKVVEAWNKGH